MHEILKKEAMAAIDRLFSDGGVPSRTTLEDMQELRDEIDIKIEALQNDAADEANASGEGRKPASERTA
ncbi:MAG TPA: hypothetical protein VMY42_08185 [Thermoguttaceae bacterium]|nr:hypothetical protein [Thermoguttaceae bacterium]